MSQCLRINASKPSNKGIAANPTKTGSLLFHRSELAKETSKNNTSLFAVSVVPICRQATS
jgi:hypothetical protein